MRIIQTIKSWHIFALIALLIVVVILVTGKKNGGVEIGATALVEQEVVRETVSVSGYIEANNTAHLSFPSTGIVTGVMVREGNTVSAGDVLATIGSRTLVAQRQEAVAALDSAKSVYSELLAGPSQASLAQTYEGVESAEVALQQVIILENEKVEKARVDLLSNDLAAYADDADTRQPAPTISGSYSCDAEGVYQIEVYRSGAYSGFSYRVSGLESDTDAAYTQQASALGECGLTIQFTEDESYANTDWAIPVPNSQSTTYNTYLTAYQLAMESRETAIANSQAALSLAEASAALDIEDPTVYEAAQAQNSILQAQAAISAIDAQIADKSIVAPFTGTITDVDILRGETAGTAPIITLLEDGTFTLTARVPEIDITKIGKGQMADVIFDARSDVTLVGIVDFVSPLATEIDGVAYFETIISLRENPEWIRSGLNADIDIVVDQYTSHTILPTRFIYENENQENYVLLNTATGVVEETITVEFTGNEGYTAISGLNAGTEVAAPVDTK